MIPYIPFGYGLSYTTLNMVNMKLSKTQLKGNEKLTATVTLTNTGNLQAKKLFSCIYRIR